MTWQLFRLLCVGGTTTLLIVATSVRLADSEDVGDAQSSSVEAKVPGNSATVMRRLTERFFFSFSLCYICNGYNLQYCCSSIQANPYQLNCCSQYLPATDSSAYPPQQPLPYPQLPDGSPIILPPGTPDGGLPAGTPTGLPPGTPDGSQPIPTNR